MDLENIIGVMNATALTIAALTAALVILPVGQDSVGDKRVWMMLIGLCLILAVRAVLQIMDSVWIQEVCALLGIGAGILIPWMAWKLHGDIRHKAESRKTG
ncbi:MAG TPA: hypothetical protein VMN77_01300 [Nitrospiria bacterium]|jgi:lysylphosphatidylglycerol synthetase-like protein (DUF2156 family)|nr:hypothetical protein [Nitrospiria bacterium]